MLTAEMNESIGIPESFGRSGGDTDGEVRKKRRIWNIEREEPETLLKNRLVCVLISVLSINK